MKRERERDEGGGEGERLRKGGGEGGEKGARVWAKSAAGSTWSKRWADIIGKNMTQVHQERYEHKETSHREDNQKRNEARVTDQSKDSGAVSRDPGRTKCVCGGGPNKTHLSA